jgi:threonine/homoserine/homoserine lactone efflux protein
MSKQIKNMLLGSMAAAGLVAVTAVVDMVLGIPYSGKMVFDIMFLISAAVVIYMGYDVLKEST